MGNCQVTRNSSGDEIAKRDLTIHAGYGGLATFEESYSHTPVLLGGVIPLDDLRDFWLVSCRMARIQISGAKISPTR